MSKRNEILTIAINETQTIYQNYADRKSLNKAPLLVEQQGYIISDMEEFFRPYWGLGAFYKDNVSITICVNDTKIELKEYLKSSVLNIISQNIPSTLDIQNFAFQAITELAGFLVGTYFSQDNLWNVFTKNEKSQIAEYIYKLCLAADEIDVKNNHIWFPALCLAVLNEFGYNYIETPIIIKKAFSILDNMYLGNGIYGDGKSRRIDYYNSYSIHLYPLLYFIITKDHVYDLHKYIKRTEQFISKYFYLFDNDGYNVQFGRSLSYTYAAVAIFPVAILAGCNINISLASSIYYKNIMSRVSQKENFTAALLENYMSSGTYAWCFKSFLALLLTNNTKFWSDINSEICLKNSTKIDEIGLATTRNNSSVTLINNYLDYDDNNLHDFSDMTSLYGKFAYNSKSGITLSSADKKSLDSMISLITPDRYLTSTRRHFEILSNTNNNFTSYHIPFSNDKKTKIITRLIPLDNGWHIRLHKVILSQPYIVHEGGFTIPIYNDNRHLYVSNNTLILCNDLYKSIICLITDFPYTYGKEFSHHGFNSLSSVALNPFYETKVLEAGTYYFASAYTLTNIDEPIICPNLQTFLDDFKANI